MTEIWKDIKDYEGIYQVSTLGNIRHLNYKGTGVNKPVPFSTYEASPYDRVKLTKDKVRKTYLVHRLVATAFIPNPNNYTDVNHIDENKHNNRVDNLEWCSRSHNLRAGTVPERIANTLSKPIICVETGIRYKSSLEASTLTGLDQSNMVKCLKGKAKSCGGYHWEYIDE